MKSRNFEILRGDWPELASLGGFAEAYVHDDPASALVNPKEPRPSTLVDRSIFADSLPLVGQHNVLSRTAPSVS